MKKVLYFTEGPVPTELETEAIDALKDGQFTLEVRNGAENIGYGGREEPCDFVAGSRPFGAYEGISDFSTGMEVGSDQFLITSGEPFNVGGVPHVATIVEGEISTLEPV